MLSSTMHRSVALDSWKTKPISSRCAVSRTPRRRTYPSRATALRPECAARTFSHSRRLALSRISPSPAASQVDRNRLALAEGCFPRQESLCHALFLVSLP